MELINILYCVIRKKDIQVAKRKLRKINIDIILKTISKNCWRYNVQYDVILKTSEMLIIKLRGKKRNIILKYHICDLVFVEDYYIFLNYFEKNYCSKGIYITTGVFEGKVLKAYKSLFLNNKIKLEDNITFIRKQIGLLGDSNQVFKYKKLRFYRYLPS